MYNSVYTKSIILKTAIIYNDAHMYTQQCKGMRIQYPVLQPDNPHHCVRVLCLMKGLPTYFINTQILRGTRNLSFVVRASLLRIFETIWILVITLECSNITASKSICRERKMRPMELSGVNFSTHGSGPECSCFDQVL